jgi:hypothetical protein
MTRYIPQTDEFGPIIERYAHTGSLLVITPEILRGHFGTVLRD